MSQYSLSWDEYFLNLVYLVSQKSKDPRTHIGAVLVKDKAIISTGYNGICRNVYDPADKLKFKPCSNDNDFKNREISPEKYFWYEHAERNAIYAAARNGIATLDSTLYTQGIPCADCARGCIQAGIKEIVVHKQWACNGIFGVKGTSVWRESLARSIKMFEEAKVKTRLVDKVLKTIGLLDGKIVKV